MKANEKNSNITLMLKKLRLHFSAVLIAAVGLSGCTETQNNRAQMEDFGTLEDGRKAELYTLTNANGMEAKITNYGGIVTFLTAPDKDGNFENVVLGFDSLDKYLDEKYRNANPYFGALIGRYGNRIGDAEFTLNGEEYQLSANDGDNHLHGGVKGFDKVLWEVVEASENSLELSYLSEDGEMGYPGNLNVTVVYSLTADNELKIEYSATTDKATPVNLTHHSYFNLSGDPASRILDHQLMVDASNYTPVDSELIPTGEIVSVEGTAFDFTEPFEIGARIDDEVEGGYDHNFVLDDADGSLRSVATLVDPESGRQMDVITEEPGLQFYSGNFLDGSLIGPDGTAFVQYSALCLETQHFPNSPNESDFPSTILEPGDTYNTTTLYRFSAGN